MSGYFKNLAEGVKTTLSGMGLTLKHALDARKRRKANNIQLDNFFELETGMVTVQYPKETVPIPDNGRYRLHNEMDDCIVCDKCAKVCPVDCIDIEPIKATEEVGRASDGSVIRLYAAKFDIDMAKCCYCGLCTTVCPTECLTMTKTFDYSEFDVKEMVYAYGNLSPEEAQQKRDLLEQFQLEKAQGKTKTTPVAETPTVSAQTKPSFKPVMKPKTASTTQRPIVSENTLPKKPATKFSPKNWNPQQTALSERLFFTLNTTAGKPAKKEVTSPQSKSGVATAQKQAGTTASGGFRPSMKPKSNAPAAPIEEKAASAKPAFRPTMKPKGTEPAESEKAENASKPAFRPTMKPKSDAPAAPVEEKPVSAKPAFRPTMKPKGAEPAESEKTENTSKPAFRPTMKPKSDAPAAPVEEKAVSAKPGFRPTMKPKGAEPAESEKTENTNKPAFRPTMKPKSDAPAAPVEEKPVSAKPAFRPTMKPKGAEPAESENTENTSKPAFKPTMKPKSDAPAAPVEEKAVSAKPVFRPTAASRSTNAPQSGENQSKTTFKPSDAAGKTTSQPIGSLPSFAPSGVRPVKPATPKADQQARFHPSGYTQSDSAGRPGFSANLKGRKIISPTGGENIPSVKEPEEAPQQTATPATGAKEKPRAGFRPTMKPKK